MQVIGIDSIREYAHCISFKNPTDEKAVVRLNFSVYVSLNCATQSSTNYRERKALRTISTKWGISSGQFEVFVRCVVRYFELAKPLSERVVLN